MQPHLHIHRLWLLQKESGGGLGDTTATRVSLRAQDPEPAERANDRAGAAYVQLAQGSSELRLAELKYGKLLTQVSAVHRQMP